MNPSRPLSWKLVLHALGRSLYAANSKKRLGCQQQNDQRGGPRLRWGIWKCGGAAFGMCARSSMQVVSQNKNHEVSGRERERERERERRGESAVLSPSPISKKIIT